MEKSNRCSRRPVGGAPLGVFRASSLRFAQRSAYSLRGFAPCVNSVPAYGWYSSGFFIAFTVAGDDGQRLRRQRRIYRRGRWAFLVSMGKIQTLSARSLVGELCARRASAHRTVARIFWSRSANYLAGL